MYVYITRTRTPARGILTSLVGCPVPIAENYKFKMATFDDKLWIQDGVLLVRTNAYVRKCIYVKFYVSEHS